jgi:hypothetical protein
MSLSAILVEFSAPRVACSTRMSPRAILVEFSDPGVGRVR